MPVEAPEAGARAAPRSLLQAMRTRKTHSRSPPAPQPNHTSQPAQPPASQDLSRLQLAPAGCSSRSPRPESAASGRRRRWLGATSLLLVLYLHCLPAHCQRGQPGFAANFLAQDGGQPPAAPDQQQVPGGAATAAAAANAATLNQLVNILQSYAAQGGQVGAARGRLPLGLVPRGLQPSLQQQQQQQISNSIQQQQQNGRRPVAFPGQQPVQMAPVVSSSPSTPFLQLNRIASGQSLLVPGSNGRPPFGAHLPQQQATNNNNNNPIQPAWLNRQQQQQVQRIFGQPLSPNRGLQAPIPVLVPRPQAGFAPSGPPPSSGANQAMVVVQSPVANASRTEPQQQRTTTTTTSSTTTTAPSSSSSELPAADSSSAPDQPTSGTTSEPDQQDRNKTVEASSWNPVEAGENATSSAGSRVGPPRTTLAPSPDIVTVPPGYNPDAAPTRNEQQTYDIPVTAQMGPAGSNRFSLTTTKLAADAAAAPSESSSAPVPSIAPTAVTTIIWTPPASEMPAASSGEPPQPIVSTAPVAGPMPQPTATNGQQQPPHRAREQLAQTTTELPAPSKPPVATDQPTPGVVYGKPETRDSKPAAPTSGEAHSANTGAQQMAGQPFIQSVKLDNQVRPFAGGQQQQQPNQAIKSQHSPIGRPSRPLGASMHQSGATNGLQLSSGFQISNHHAANQSTLGDIQDYLSAQPPLLLPSAAAGGPSQSTAGPSSSAPAEPTISAHGGLDPAASEVAPSHRPVAPVTAQVASPVAAEAAAPPAPPQQQPRLRRPTFKPRPAVPPIRIDSCIVDDDTSCDPDNNERCVTEYGISSCHCKPGYARLSQLRGFCSPIDAFQVQLKIDRLSDDRKLVYNHTLADPNSEEYQYLEFEAQQALAGAFQQSAAVKHLFMGARVNKFYERKGKVWANVSLHLGSNNDTTAPDKLQAQVSQELVARLTGPGLKTSSGRGSSGAPLGDSTILLDGSRESVSKLTDVNECASKELNDCSKFATCSNDFGTYHCQCLPGYEDKHAAAADPRKLGRTCLGCSAAYCSNRGECSIVEGGERRCKCRPNFVGARCDIDTEVLAVAVGGSFIGLIILLGTFWCLFVFNRRWRREQQKLDAMSATSGLTYNYVNSASTNSLMSPARNSGPPAPGGLHRSGGHHHQQVAAGLQRLTGSGAAHQQYASDQQAIIGSTSSGSSAASHQQLCAASSYAAAMYQHQQQQQQQQYEDGGLLIAPASTSSSQQTSPTSNSYRNLHVPHQHLVAGSAYTLSGHHYQHHQQAVSKPGQLSQFHAALGGADYRTLAGPAGVQPQYDSRWRTLQQEHAKQNGSLGYYLSPDMLVGGQQQVYASPQRELCIDTTVANHNKSRRQQGRSQAPANLRARSHGPHNTLYYNQSDYN